MTDLPDPTALPDDSWMPDGPAVAPKPAPKAKPKAKVTPLRPIDALAAELDEAAASGAPPLPPEDPPPPPEAMGPAEPGGPPSRSRPYGAIWDGCPVRALGVNGGTYYYLDVLNQMRGIDKLEGQQILKLFGHKGQQLCLHYPQWTTPKDGEPAVRKPNRYDQQTAAMDMYAAAAEKGLFSPDGAVRGVGAWTDDSGRLVYHLGDRVLVDGKELAPDAHDGRIYPAYPKIPHPVSAQDAAKALSADDPAQHIRQAFECWRWARPQIDPTIGLGMIGCLMMGGALSWRPFFWATGSRAWGKSTLQTLIGLLLGGKTGLVQSSDATRSAITSRLGHSSLPVALDELEPDDSNPGREKAIIELARVASSGGEWMRGSADQKGVSGNIQSTFLASSILIPGSMKPQDRSRLVILALEPPLEGAAPPPMQPEIWRKRGAVLKRLLIDRWPTWQRRLDLWREALAAQRITGRDADNYGTIIAMAHMARSAELPTPAELTEWSAKIAGNVRATVEEIGTDADEVLTHLLSQAFDPFRRGERHSVATWLKAAGQRPRAGRRLFGQSQDAYVADQDTPEVLLDWAKRANNALASIGLRVIGTADRPELFVATKQMQGLKDIFRHSTWAGGAWTDSLKRVKDAKPNQGPRYIDGQQTKGTVIPFASMPGLLAFDGEEVAVVPLHGAHDIEEFV